VVFLTAVTSHRRPILANAAAFEILSIVWRRSAASDGWFVGDYLLMPDHVHLFARAALESKSLACWVGTWKSITSRHLKLWFNLRDALWQSDYFDRFLRSSDSYTQKWDYVAENPVRNGLCRSPNEWPWKGRIHDLKF
jgi:putative transposase